MSILRISFRVTCEMNNRHILYEPITQHNNNNKNNNENDNNNRVHTRFM